MRETSSRNLQSRLALKAIEATPAIVLMIDFQGDIIFVNPFFEALTGKMSEHTVGEKWFLHLLPPSEQHPASSLPLSSVSSVLAQRTPSTLQVRGGREVEIRWSTDPSFDEAGELDGLVCLGVKEDSTGAVSSWWREISGWFTSLLGNMPNRKALYGINAKGSPRVLATNINAFGASEETQTPEALIGAPPEVLLEHFGLSPHDIEAERLRFNNAIATGQPHHHHIELMRGEERCYYNVSLVPAQMQGACTHLLWTAIDVTERHQVEQSLRASQARLNEAQKLSKVGSWDLNLKNNQLNWSDEVYKIFEHDLNSYAPSYEGFLQTIHPDDRALVDASYAKSLEDRSPYMIEHRLQMPDGRIKYVCERGISFYDDEGNPLRSMGTVQDISERKGAEERLRSSLREKESLLREVHHRVKNNLQVITGLLHFQAQKISSEEGRRAFEDIERRIFSMLLVHEHLYQSEALSMVDFVAYIRKLTDETLRSFKLKPEILTQVNTSDTIYLPIEVALPAGMILSELMTNTLKHAFAGRSKGLLTISLEREDDRVVFRHEDDGVGLPAGFDSETMGLLGWQLIRMLLLQLGGEITTSSNTEGTSVEVRFSSSIHR